VTEEVTLCFNACNLEGFFFSCKISQVPKVMYKSINFLHISISAMCTVYLLIQMLVVFYHPLTHNSNYNLEMKMSTSEMSLTVCHLRVVMVLYDRDFIT